MANPSVIVITPSVGRDTLGKVIASVDNQTYHNVTHLVVGDGPETFNAICKNAQVDFKKSRLKLTFTPENTGGNGFYGHRIYAAYPHLVNADFIFFLDEDNWYEPDHVTSMVSLMQEQNLDWAFSLRNICRPNGDYFVPDCCESIGKWPVFWSQAADPQFLVDTSTYGFRREWLIGESFIWHGGWGQDRKFFNAVRGSSRYNTTGLHTMNYRLDDNMIKKYGSEDFFHKGNAVIQRRYGGYPWHKKT